MRSLVVFLSVFLVACSSLPRRMTQEALEETSLCHVMEHIDTFANANVSMNVAAVAAPHEFDVVLSDDSCPGRYIFLSAGSEFREDKNFVWMMKRLYPGYPSDDGHRDTKVPIHVRGTIVRKKNQNLLMTYLELQSIGK